MRRVRRTTVGGLALVLLLGAVACSAEESPEPEPTPSASASSSPTARRGERRPGRPADAARGPGVGRPAAVGPADGGRPAAGRHRSPGEPGPAGGRTRADLDVARAWPWSRATAGSAWWTGRAAGTGSRCPEEPLRVPFYAPTTTRLSTDGTHVVFLGRTALWSRDVSARDWQELDYPDGFLGRRAPRRRKVPQVVADGRRERRGSVRGAWLVRRPGRRDLRAITRPPSGAGRVGRRRRLRRARPVDTGARPRPCSSWGPLGASAARRSGSTGSSTLATTIAADAASVAAVRGACTVGVAAPDGPVTQGAASRSTSTTCRRAATSRSGTPSATTPAAASSCRSAGSIADDRAGGRCRGDAAGRTPTGARSSPGRSRAVSCGGWAAMPGGTDVRRRDRSAAGAVSTGSRRHGLRPSSTSGATSSFPTSGATSAFPDQRWTVESLE